MCNPVCNGRPLLLRTPENSGLEPVESPGLAIPDKSSRRSVGRVVARVYGCGILPTADRTFTLLQEVQHEDTHPLHRSHDRRP